MLDPEICNDVLQVNMIQTNNLENFENVEGIVFAV